MPSKPYFATRPSSEIGKALMERLKPLIEDEDRGNREEMRNAYMHVYGQDAGYGITSGVTRGGTEGELAQVRMGGPAGVARAKHALITSAKLAWKPQAKDGSASAAETTAMAADVLEDLWKSNGLSVVVSEWVKRALQFSCDYVFAEWDKTLGPALLAMGDRYVHQGDIRLHNIPAWDVYFDNAAPSYRSLLSRWMRIPCNRYELAARYTRLADGREGTEAEDAILNAAEASMAQSITDGDRERYKDSDLTPLWHWFHEPSAALPMGRHVILLSDNVVLLDETLRGPNATYEGLPLIRLADQEMVGGPHARAVFWDTLGGGEILDAIDTGLATRATTLANPIIAYEKGSDLRAEMLANGPATWQYPRGAKPPAEIQTQKVPGEMLEYRQAVETAITKTMGLNDVALGQPQSAQMNAQAFAVLASMATQQSSPFQDAYCVAVAALGLSCLKTYAKQVKHPRSLKSKMTGGTLSKWQGSQLADVETVFVEIGNPLEQTAAGRKAILDDKMAKGWIATPEQYDQVLSTGRSEPVSRRNTAEMTLVQWEVEQLRKGKTPPVHQAMNHPLHYREASAAIMEPGCPDKVVAAVELFLERHYELQFGVQRNKDPLAIVREAWMLGQPPGPGQDPMAMGPPPMGAPPGEPPPPGDAMPPPPDVVPPAAADIPPPENPMTGQPFNPVDGGGVVQN